MISFRLGSQTVKKTYLGGFMKRTILILGFLMVFICTAAEAQQNIGGVWREASSNEIKDSIVVISQDGNRLTLCSSWMFKGSQIVWQGSGSINGRKVIYEIKHTKFAPVGSSRGLMSWNCQATAQP